MSASASAPLLGDAAAALGLPVFPCGKDKKPLRASKGFKDATLEPAAIQRAFAQPKVSLIGVPTGAASGLVVIDIDIRDGRSGMDWIKRNRHLLPKTRAHRTRSGGLHLIYRNPEGARIRNSQSRLAPGVDVRGDGGYAIFPPSPGYRVVDPAIPPADMPPWLVDACCKPEAEPQPAPEPKKPPRAEGGTPYGLTALNRECDAIRAAPFGRQEGTLNAAALKIGRLVAGGELDESIALADLIAAGRNMASQAGRPPWRADDVEAKVRRGFADGQRSPRKAPPGRKSQASNKDTAEPAQPAREGEASNVIPLRPRPGGTDLDGFDLTEDGVALAFAARHEGQLLYCHDTGSWYEWTGVFWRPDRTRKAFNWTRKTSRDMASPANDQAKTRIGRAAFAAGVERFAQADEQFAVTSEMWDRDPFLLGTPGGVVELPTAELRPARQADGITRLTAVAPAAAPDCPIWLGFLDQATAGDQGLIRFLRQWCGYSLTGDTREHALLFGFGPGGNGKSVFVNTVAGIMGSYALTAGMETFTASQHERHSTELARLRGARMVTASETEEGRAWAETRIKQITGGDPITARFMRQDDFTYVPQFKLTIIGNSKPVLKNVDEAARRRFNIVPFLNEPSQPDRHLEAKLKAEWPAILRWMIEGCLDWQLHGLVRPKVVTDATAEYFEAQDHFARWLAECCDLLPTASTKPSHLLHSFTQWCQANGEQAPTGKSFKTMIERVRVLRYGASTGVAWVRGIAIRPEKSRGEGEE